MSFMLPLVEIYSRINRWIRAFFVYFVEGNEEVASTVMYRSRVL